MPNDAGPLGLDHDDVEVHVLGSGFGGVAVGTREWISVALLEPGVGEYRFVVHADVPRGESILPSVLGRDILDRCRLTYDPTNGVLDLEVWRSDDFVPA